MDVKKTPKRDIRTPEGWIIQPPLWVDVEERSFVENGIKYVVDGETIKAEVKGTNLSGKEFLQEASSTVERFVNAYMIVKGVFFEIPGLTAKYFVSQPSYPTLEVLEDGKKTICKNYEDVVSAKLNTWTEKVGDEQKDYDLSYWIFDRCKKDVTLREALSYYRLALTGIDQLVPAGNLYMAMEEVGVRFRKKKEKWQEAWEELVKYRLATVKSEDEWIEDVEKVGDMLQKGRHAWFKPQKGPNKDKWVESDEIPQGEMNFCIGVVREIILAYVGWLRRNKDLS